jgi:mRNA interferase MazF
VRGAVWWVDLDPLVGREANKRRPAVLVGRDSIIRATLERGTGTVTVVPITSHVQRVFDFQVLLPVDEATGLDEDSKAQAEQIRTVDVSRLVAQAGQLNAEHLSALDEAMLLHLGLEQ